MGYNPRMQVDFLKYEKDTTELLELAYSYTSASHPGNNGQITCITDHTGAAGAPRPVAPWTTPTTPGRG